jgi:hypothetical protein
MRTFIEHDSVMEVEVRGIKLPVDFGKATDVEGFVRRCFEYGLGRKFNDAAARGLDKAPAKSSFRTEEEFTAAYASFANSCAANAEAMIKDWLAGKFEAERAARAESDPFTGWAKKFIRTAIMAKPANADLPKAEIDEMVKQAMANESIGAKLRKQWDALNAVEIEV